MRAAVLKRHVLTLLLLGAVLGFALAASQALAADVSTVPTDLTAFTPTGSPTANLKLLIGRIIRLVISFLGIVFVCLIVYAGYLYLLSGGDPEKVKKSTRIIRNAIIGLAITLASYGIAVFVINAIFRAAGIGQPGVGESTAYLEPLSGALGAGIIQDHYPPRAATDVPRNAKVIVTFKEPMYLPSLLVESSIDADAEAPVGQVNANNVKIYRTAAGVTNALTASQVNVTFTADHKTFVFDPVPLLGSPEEEQNYTVYLSPNILKVRPDNTTVTAFPPPNQTGYEWWFQVSTVVDNTPPYVATFIPAASETYARNIVVQVNFSEPIDPTSVSGIYQPPTDRFLNMQVRDDGGAIEGTWSISNGFKTAEFVTFDQCGQNPCGGAIYCLPPSSNLTVFARAATLSTEAPAAQWTSIGYDGVVDVAGNSLDGGGEEGGSADGIAQGQPPATESDLAEDNFWSEFSTNASTVTTAPKITPSGLLPNLNTPEVPVDQDVEITFDQPMRASTLNNTHVALEPRPWHEMWYTLTVQNGIRAVIEHGLFRDTTADLPSQQYYPVLNNEIESLYQICFYPTGGPPGDCSTNPNQPSCCDGVATASGTCPLPAESPISSL